MKSICIVALAVVAVYAGETYDTKNDNFDIAGLVANPKLLQIFLDCFNDKGPCDPLAAEFKKNLAEAVEQACAKCSPMQKHMVNVFTSGAAKVLPEAFQEFKQKYDPQNKYFPALISAVGSS